MSEFDPTVTLGREIDPGTFVGFEDDDSPNHPNRTGEQGSAPNEYDASHDQESLSNTAYTYKEVDGAFHPIEHDEDGNEIVNMDPGLVLDIKDKEQQDAYDEACTTGEPVEFEMLKRMPDLNGEVVLWKINQIISVHESEHGVYMTLATKTEKVSEEEDDPDSNDETQDEPSKDEVSKPTHSSENEENDDNKDPDVDQREAEIATALAAAKNAAETVDGDNADDIADSQPPVTNTSNSKDELTPAPDNQEADSAISAQAESASDEPMEIPDTQSSTDISDSDTATKIIPEATTSSSVTAENLLVDDRNVDETNEPKQARDLSETSELKDVQDHNISAATSKNTENNQDSNIQSVGLEQSPEPSETIAVGLSATGQDQLTATPARDLEPAGKSVTSDGESSTTDKTDTSAAEAYDGANTALVEEVPELPEHDLATFETVIDTPTEAPAAEQFIEQTPEANSSRVDELAATELQTPEAVLNKPDDVEQAPEVETEAIEPIVLVEDTTVLRVRDIESKDNSTEFRIDLRPTAKKDDEAPAIIDNIDDTTEDPAQTPPSKEPLLEEAEANSPEQTSFAEQIVDARPETLIESTTLQHEQGISLEPISTPDIGREAPAKEKIIRSTPNLPPKSKERHDKPASPSQISIRSIREAMYKREKMKTATNKPSLTLQPNRPDLSEGRNKQLQGYYNDDWQSVQGSAGDLYFHGPDMILDTFYEPRGSKRAAESHLSMEVLR